MRREDGAVLLRAEASLGGHHGSAPPMGPKAGWWRGSGHAVAGTYGSVANQDPRRLMPPPHDPRHWPALGGGGGSQLLNGTSAVALLSQLQAKVDALESAVPKPKAKPNGKGRGASAATAGDGWSTVRQRWKCPVCRKFNPKTAAECGRCASGGEDGGDVEMAPLEDRISAAR